MPAVSTPAFYSHRLIEAVKARGFTWKELSKLAFIKASTLSDYKNGNITPSLEQLEKIAVALEFPVDYFLRPSLPGSALKGPRLFRASTSITQRAADQAETRLSWAAQALAYADRYLHTPQPTFLQAYSHLVEPLSLDNDQIELIALSVREKLGFGRGPVTHLVRAMEKAGMVVLRYESLSHIKMDGLSQHTESGRPLCAIITSENMSLARENFSLAHELGHIVLHAQIPEHRYNELADGKLLEDQANLFASAFLLPSESFIPEVVAPSLGQFVHLKKKWRTSIAAMIRRCRQLNRITNQEYSSLQVRLSQRRWRSKEPLDDLLEPERPILLQQVFRALSSRDGIKGSRIAQDLSLSSRDLASISELPVSFFQEAQLGDNIIEFAPVQG